MERLGKILRKLLPAAVAERELAEPVLRQDRARELRLAKRIKREIVDLERKTDVP
jgi:hypothetical protein